MKIKTSEGHPSSLVPESTQVPPLSEPPLSNVIHRDNRPEVEVENFAQTQIPCKV